MRLSEYLPLYYINISLSTIIIINVDLGELIIFLCTSKLLDKLIFFINQIMKMDIFEFHKFLYTSQIRIKMKKILNYIHKESRVYEFYFNGNYKK